MPDLRRFRVDARGPRSRNAGRQAGKFFFQLFGLPCYPFELFAVLAVFFFPFLALLALPLFLGTEPALAGLCVPGQFLAGKSFLGRLLAFEGLTRDRSLLLELITLRASRS